MIEFPSETVSVATMATRTDDRPTSRGALLLAILVSVVVGTWVPLGGYLLYPFTLMATWVHEMGHGLAAILSGGRFVSLDVFASAGGLAHTFHTPGAEGFVCAAGLLGPPIAGAFILAMARGPRRARMVLVVLAAVMVLSLVLWVRSLAGWIALPLVAALVVGFARWGSPREVLFLAQLLGLRLAVDTVTRIDYVFSDEAVVNGVTSASDISRVAAAWGGAQIFWSLALAGLSCALVGVGLWAAWRAPRGPATRSPGAASASTNQRT
jgi:Peptidase M50B-like